MLSIIQGLLGGGAAGQRRAGAQARHLQPVLGRQGRCREADCQRRVLVPNASRGFRADAEDGAVEIASFQHQNTFLK